MKTFLAILLLASTLSCKSTVPESAEDEVIAQVGNSILKKSKIASLYTSDINDEERNVLIKGYVSNWIRDQLMINEAEKSIPTDININSLVADYRSSLILNYYENKLVSELLDTLVSIEQKAAYYEESKDEFILSESIFKGVSFKLPKSKNSAAIKKAFKENDFDLMYSLLDGKIDGIVIKEGGWYAVSEILSRLPSKVYDEKSISRKGDNSKRIGDYEYFVKTIDFVSKNEVPPLAYIDSKIIQIILNNRKKALIKRKKQQLYDQNYQNNKIKINIK